MFKNRQSPFLLAAALGMGAIVASNAQASSITVQFNTDPTSVTLGGGTNGQATVTYNNIGTTTKTTPNNPTLPYTFTGVNFGSLDVSFNGNWDFTDADSKTLSIVLHQSLPDAGSGDFTADVTGTFHFLSPDTLALDWTDTSITIPDSALSEQVTYALSVSNMTFSSSDFIWNYNNNDWECNGNGLTGNVTISATSGGTMTTTPLPTPLYSGLGMLGLIAGASMLRHRKLGDLTV